MTKETINKYLGKKVIITIKNGTKLKGNLSYDENYDNYHLTKINEPTILLKCHNIVKIEKWSIIGELSNFNAMGELL